MTNRNRYENIMAGCDVGVFPSFYEPWGYTALESTALAVPTITSDLAGTITTKQAPGRHDHDAHHQQDHAGQKTPPQVAQAPFARESSL